MQATRLFYPTDGSALPMPSIFVPIKSPARSLLVAVFILAGCHGQQTTGTDVSIRTSLVATPQTLPLDGASTSQLVARVTTASGKPRVGFTLDLAPQDGGLLIVTDMTPTNDDGQSYGVVRCLTAGAHDIGLTTQYNSMSVALTEYTPITCVQTFTVGPPSAATSTMIAEPHVAAVDDANGILIRLTVQDANGYSVGPNIPIALVADGSTTSVNPNAVVTDNFGMAYAHVTSTIAQTEHVTATLGSSSTAATLSTTVSFVAGSPSAHTSSWTANPNVLSVSSSTVFSTAHLSLRDRYANPVGNSLVNVRASGAADMFSRPSGLSDAQGHFSTQWQSTTAQSKSLVVQAGDTALYTGATFVGGNANVLTCTSLHTTAYVGVPQSLTVAAVDIYGNWAPNYSGQVVITASLPSANVPSGYSFGASDGGGHTFIGGVTFGQSGNQFLTVVDNANAKLQCILPVAPVFEVPTVGPLYSSASAWTRWVRNDGPAYNATGTLCDGSEAGDYRSACVHGGSMRAVSVPSAQDCNGLSAADNLGAFAWTCDANGAVPRMVSASLTTGQGLMTLLNASASAFQPMSVTVQQHAATLFTTAPAVWWPDTLTQATGGGALSGNTINVLDPNTPGNYTVSSANTAVIVPQGRTLTAASAASAHLSVLHTQFVWLEGAFASVGAPQSIFVSDSNHVVVRSATLAGASNQGLLASGMRQSIVDGVLVNYLSGAGMGLAQQSSGNLIKHVRISAPSAQGLQVIGQSTANLFVDVAIAASSDEGVYMAAQSNKNIFDGLWVSNAAMGIVLDQIQGGVLHDVVVVNSAHAGVSVSQSADIVWAAATLAGSGDTAGFQADALANGVVAGAVFVNNAGDGVLLAGSSNNTFINVSSAHNMGTGLSMADAASVSNSFWGAALLGNNAAGDCNTLPGLGQNGLYTAVSPGACTTDPTVSSVQVTANTNFAASFMGPVTTTDSVNFNNNAGASVFANIVDWTHFTNTYRAWGIAAASSVDPNDHGACSAAHAACQIYDWRLRIADEVLRNGVPTPSQQLQTLQHTWSDGSRAVFYPGASERLGDGVGNDNGLCESGEDCTAEPNFGAYQGEGALASPITVGGFRLFSWQMP